MAFRLLSVALLSALPLRAYAMAPLTSTNSLGIALICCGLVIAVLGWAFYQLRQDRQHAERLINELETQNQLFHQVLHSSPIGIMIQGPDRTILHYNEALTHILDLPAHTLVDHKSPLRTLIEDEQVRKEFYQHYREMLRQPRHLHDWEMAIRTASGQRKWVKVSGQTLVRDGKVMGILWMVRDVTFEHRAKQKLERLTRTDPLTGLLNRRAFLEAWHHLTRMAYRYRHPLSMALIDLDHFKQINDRWGHHVGDHVLKWFAEQMRHTFRKADVIARLGGEEFVVLMPHTSSQNAFQALEQLRKRLRKAPIGLDDLPKEFTIDFSAGVTEWRRGELFEFTYHRADMLLYRAKAEGRGLSVSDSPVAETKTDTSSTG